MTGYPGFAYARGGRIAEAHRISEELRGCAQKTYVSNFTPALICVGLGEIDNALHWLERAADKRDSLIPHFCLCLHFNPLRLHPRYPTLLRKMSRDYCDYRILSILAMCPQDGVNGVIR
jgi:hypothetical protein